MRRKGTKILSFLLVLVMAFSLLPVSALAEGETGTDATTTQPRSGYMFTESPSGTVYIDPETLEWHITWTTNFVPSRVDLVKTVDGVDSAIMLAISEPGMTQSYDIQAYHGSGSYRLRAYTGQDDNSVYSSSFTLDISNLLFLSSPMDNGYDPDTLKCHIVWTTNFVPARMGLVKIEGETERETTPGITEPGLTQSYDIFAYNGSGDYYLKAYTSRDTTCRDCVRSQVFHVNDSALRFTVQPQGGTFDPDTLSCTVSWQTSFIPAEIEVRRIEDDDSVLLQRNAPLGKDFSVDMKASWGQGDYFIRAYYNITVGQMYVDSDTFHISNSSLCFTIQPEDCEFSFDTRICEVSWETNFDPMRVSIFRRADNPEDQDFAVWTEGVNADKAMSYDLRATYGAGYYYVRAYYRITEPDSQYVTSRDFYVGEAVPRITVQPQSGSVDPETMTYTINWDTNFTPYNAISVYGYSVVDGEPTFTDNPVFIISQNAKSYEFSWEQIASRNSYVMSMKYGHGGSDSIHSQPFTISLDSLKFIKFPTGGPIDPDTLTYTVGWETSFTPYKVEICHYEKDSAGDTYVVADEELQYFTTLTPAYQHPVSLDTLLSSDIHFVRAYYGTSQNSGWVDSPPFSVDFAPLAFTNQPQSGVYESDSNNYTVSWETNFTPTKVEICHTLPDGTVQVDHTVSSPFSSLPRNNDYTMNSAYGSKAFFLRAYYSGDYYVSSALFTVTDGQHQFTVQPADSMIDIGTLKSTAHWETSFIPQRIEVVHYTGDAGTPEPQILYSQQAALEASMDYDITAEHAPGEFYIRAWYGSDEYIISRGFTVSADSLVFNVEPYLYEYDTFTGEYLINWETSFVPKKIVIMYTVGDSLYNPVEDAVLTSGYDTNGFYIAVPPYGDNTYYIYAYYGEGSRDFVMAYLRISPAILGFTNSPESGSFIEGPATYPISWTTNFVPRKVQILRTDGSVVKTIANEMKRTMSYDLPATSGEGVYLIRAYYTQFDDTYVQSEVFVVTYPGPMFTKQPQSGGATETTAHEAHWNTSFTPLRLELWSLKAGEHEKIGELNAAATAQAFTYSQAIQYNDRSLYYRAWFGEGEDDYITSVLFDVRPRIVLPEYTLDAVGASHVFTSEELYDGGNYKEYNAYNNNYTCDGTFSYYVDFSPELQDHGLSLILLDEHENEVAVANLWEGTITYEGMPEGVLEYHEGNDSVDINVSFADLREIMAGSEAENPDIFSICLSIDVNGHNDEYNLYDSHIPINDPWQEVDFENITLESKSFVPKLEFYDWAPGIASVETEWYTALTTSVLIKDDDGNVFYERDPYPPVFTDENGDEQNWKTYFFSFSDEPIDREFAKYYGDGYCDWIVGPANPAYSSGRGPANYKFGLVAKHITKTADTIEGTGVSLSDFIDEESIEYFNSLVGLSPYAENGYFTDLEEAEDYDLPWYDLLCKINCVIKVTFEDGVTYRTGLDLVHGGESAGFEVKGEPYILPGVITVNEDEGCTVTVIANYDDENGGTIVNSGDTVKGGTVLTVITEARPGYEIVTKPDDSYTVEGNLDLSAESRRITYPLSLVYSNSAPPDASVSDLTAVPYGESVTVTAGAPDPGYEFTGWYQPNGKRVTEDVSYTFQMYGAVKLEARYRQITGIVTFMSNSNVKKTMTAASITEADYPADVTPYYGYVFDGWDKTVEDVNAVLITGNSITVNAKFKEAPVNYTVTVYNGEEETPTVTEYSQSVFIPLRAREVEGKNFAYWLLDGEILSYRKNVSFKSMSDCTVRAVYTEGTVEAKGTAIMKRITYNVDAKKLQFVSYLTLPDGAKLISAGLVAASGSGSYDPDTELTEDNAEYVKKSSATGNVASVSYTWNKTNVKPGDVWYSRAYVKYLLDGEEKTVYGDRMVTSAGNDYDTDEHGTAIIKSKSYDPSTKKAVFNSYTTVPENGIIVKAGLVASSGLNFDPTKEVLTAANADYVKLSAKVVGISTALSYTWSKTKVEPGDTWFVRSYLVYTLNGIEHTVYGELVSLTA